MIINITTFPFGLDCGSMQLNSWDVGQEVSPRTEKCKAKKQSTRVTDLIDGFGWSGHPEQQDVPCTSSKINE